MMLLNPGPVNVSERVRQALMKPDLCHRESEFTELLHAIQALVAAEGEDAVAEILGIYPILLTDTAQDALSNLVADALARDDHDLSEKASSCQALLRTIRAGLEEHEEHRYD